MQTNTRINSLAASLLAGAITMTALITPLMAEDKPAPAFKAEQAEKLEMFNGKVEELNLEAKTIVVAKKTYLIMDATKVVDRDKDIKLADLKVGTEVHGLAKKNAAGKLEATIIKLGPKPHEQAPPKTEKPKE